MNHSSLSGPTVSPLGPEPLCGMKYSVMVPLGVILPILLAFDSQNRRSSYPYATAYVREPGSAGGSFDHNPGAILGHDITMLMRVYGHQIPSAEDTAAKALQNALAGA
ncbi:MAG TPA: hypothetical protein VFF60_04325 [Candidatus Binatus sp.]|nr:hypothetical protein [Candidatus Binatus sp.]